MQLTLKHAEAINVLRSSNIDAWNILVQYFEDCYRYQSDQCVDIDKEKVPIHQGMARVYRDLSNIEELAERVYNASKK